MPYTEIKRKKGKKYYYRVKSIREREKVRKQRIYLGANLSKSRLSKAELKADSSLNRQKDLTKEAYQKALEVLDRISTPHGFNAAFPGYDAVWARDSIIISLGASLFPKYKAQFKKSLEVLAEAQSQKGQIPNAVDIFSKRKPHIDFQSIDSTLWFLIGHKIFQKRFKDFSLLKSQSSNIEKALIWLSYQDMGEDSMPEQLPTTDWQDAFPHRYGHTINTQALYYYVLKLYKKDSQANKLKKEANKSKDNKLWNGSFYLPWRWKNHGKYHEKGGWFDSLGNLLAILFDLADSSQSLKIISHIKEKGIDKPFPIKTIYPPIKKGSRDWQPYFENCDARTPFHYSNAGIWTYIGAFYVLALIKLKKFNEAEEQLKKLAQANLYKGSIFSEWLNGKTGSPGGGDNQGWNAGMYLLAFESLKKKRVLL